MLLLKVVTTALVAVESILIYHWNLQLLKWEIDLGHCLLPERNMEHKNFWDTWQLSFSNHNTNFYMKDTADEIGVIYCGLGRWQTHKCSQVLWYSSHATYNKMYSHTQTIIAVKCPLNVKHVSHFYLLATQPFWNKILISKAKHLYRIFAYVMNYSHLSELSYQLLPMWLT